MPLTKEIYNTHIIQNIYTYNTHIYIHTYTHINTHTHTNTHYIQYTFKITKLSVSPEKLN